MQHSYSRCVEVIPRQNSYSSFYRGGSQASELKQVRRGEDSQATLIQQVYRGEDSQAT